MTVYIVCGRSHGSYSHKPVLILSGVDYIKDLGVFF